MDSKLQVQDMIQGYASFQRVAASWKFPLRSTTVSVMHTDVNLQSVFKINKCSTAVMQGLCLRGILRNSPGCSFLRE